MGIIKKNIVANFSGSVWTGLMGLVFVPLYIHFLGIEAYGLIGIFATLLAIFGLLDMGLSSTLNREMAWLAVRDGKTQEMRDLVRTLEIPYWLVGLLISVIVIVLSPFIAYHWINAKNIAPKTVQTAIMFMGFAVAFQWPMSFYSGGLMGLQRQVLLNVINIVMATFRGLGAVLILWLVSPTVEAFFSWQIVVSVVHIGLIVFFLWRSLPYAAEPPRFRRELLLNIWRFAAGMTGITVLATILMQLDKVILSRMLSLEMFGYYTLAGVVAMTLYRLIGPVFSAIYPRFTQLVSLGDQHGLKELYHTICQFISVLIFPVGFIITFFSYDLLLIWTQNQLITENTYLLVSILTCAMVLSGLMYIPYALQLAYGWTRLNIYTNLIAVILLTPLMILMTSQYGAVGGASVQLILNSGYVLIAIHFMHRRLLRHEKWRWYWEDVGVPLVAAMSTAGMGRFLIGSQTSRFMMMFYLIIVSIFTLGVTAMATPSTRTWILSKIPLRRITQV
jgi:O-antigen/teichoic acid export membrane protein